jgi:hypothetical protein
MPFAPLIIRPGCDVESTPLLLEAGWSATNLIRFFQSKIQKIGGWQRLISQALTGVCRGMIAWADLTGVPYIMLGTNTNVEVYYNGQLYDVTPIRKTSNAANSLSTVNTTNVVTIHDVAHGASASDTVDIVPYSAVGGVVLQGYYSIQTIVDADHYTIHSVSNATSTVTNGGHTSLFTTTATSGTVQVTLTNHGFASGAVYTVHISTSVGGLTIYGDYIVGTVIDANNFNITVTGSAASSTSGRENADAIQYQYLIPSGPASAAIAAGWGEGGYGQGPYGQGATSSAVTPLRQWSMLNFGKLWMGCPTNGAIYLWDPSGGEINNPATLSSINAPPQNTGIFLAMPQQQIVAFGAYDPINMYQDPMLVRWCDVGDYTSWTTSVTNQAGSFRLPRGSKIVGGMQGPQFGILWTDLGVWQMQYISFPLVYGFNEIASGCGLIAMRAAGILAGDIYWMSKNEFFVSNGASVQVLPCSVWDIVFGNLNTFQADKITCAVNSFFNEIAWYFPSLSGNGENDTYVKYNSVDRTWDYGSLARTAWFDQSVFGPPMGVDTSGLIQQHETSTDADGIAMQPSATTGWFKISEGTIYAFIERLIGDFIYDGNATLQVTVETTNYPNQTPNSVTFNVTSATEYNIIRLRGRLARVTISSNDVGSFWRLGEILTSISQSGRR